MNEQIKQRCDLLVENRQEIGKASLFQEDLIRTVAAYAFVDKDKKVDSERLKECLKLIKKKQGLFSEFRGTEELIVASKMALSDDPEKYLDDAIKVYKQFQKGKFFDSAYRLLATMSICDAGKTDEAERIIAESEDTLKKVSDKHPFVSSESNICFAVLLAIMEHDTASLLEEIEISYKELKKTFYDNAAYSLAQILLAYKGSAEVKCAKVFELFNALREKKARYGKGQEIAILGTMVNIPVNSESLVNEIIETEEYLKGQKGFKMLDMSTETRLMLAGMIVSGVYTKDELNKNSAFLGGTVAMVIAEQIVMLIIIMSATTAAAAASSSN